MSSRSRKLTEPVSKRDLTTREKIILLEGSKLYGLVFPPWKAAPEPAEFELPVGEGQYVYEDNTNLPLSPLQKEAFNGWRRPHEFAHQPRDGCDNAVDAHCGTLDLVQDVVSDCSVVASLCAVIARSERDNDDIWKSSMYPYSADSRTPAASQNGKYVFRFHFNGCYRRVVIDDRLPSSRTLQALHVVNRNNIDTYWPALIEKAYLKVRGGYDFPGSNSGTDLWVLTGWIPEQIFLQSDGIDCDALWRRLLKAFNYGDVLITMGTGKLTGNEERGLGLAGEHDYSIIDIKEDRGQRLFLVKNPWSNGQVWKGHIRYQDPVSNMDEQLQCLRLEDRDLRHSSGRELETPGTFWMPLNDIFLSFESIYLNWNPALFPCREDVHFRWDLSETESTDGCLWSNPQYSIRNENPGVVWLLLSRHFSSSPPKKIVENEAGFISLYAFHSNGQRVILSDGPVAHSPYVDSPNALLKVDLAPSSALTIVVSEQTLPRKANCFSLSAFSFSPVALIPASEKYAHNSVVNGTWTTATSGGNTGSPLYHVNPQFSIALTQQSNVAMLLRTTEPWSVHVNVVWANGKQIRSVTTRDVVGDSGEYRRGCTYTEILDVPIGNYTIVCSTFEPNQTGGFELSVGTTVPSQIARVATSAAGRFVTPLRSVIWTPKDDRLVAALVSRRLNRVSVSAKSRQSPGLGQQHCSLLKVSIEQGWGPTNRMLAVSEEDSFRDAQRIGVHTPDVDILPEACAQGLRIVLDRLGSSDVPPNEAVDVHVLSDAPIEVGAWLQEDSYEQSRWA